MRWCHGQVEPDERRGAELDYCKRFGLTWLQAGGHIDPEKSHPSTDFLMEHPRFLALIHSQSCFIWYYFMLHYWLFMTSWTLWFLLSVMSLFVCSEYGAPDEGEMREQKPFALKNQLLSMNLQHQINTDHLRSSERLSMFLLPFQP